MARFLKRRKGRNGNGHKPHCSVHKGVIHGKVHFWNRQPMCLNCYRRFTVGGPNGGVKIVHGHPTPQKKKGFWANLFG